MIDFENLLASCLDNSGSRAEFYVNLVNALQAKSILELGVYRGDFAEVVLKECASVKSYFMLDPWRHLSDWNKPSNQNNQVFEHYMRETLAKTDFAKSKRILLRGKTTEVIDEIPDQELDFAYIDGDHTLKGITIDLIRVWSKVKEGGWIGGDDFSPSIWQHSSKYEPTLVFPFAVYFAEAVGCRIYGLPYTQFIIHKDSRKGFEFIDLANDYQDVEIGRHLHFHLLLRKKFQASMPRLYNFFAAAARRLR